MSQSTEFAAFFVRFRAAFNARRPSRASGALACDKEARTITLKRSKGEVAGIGHVLVFNDALELVDACFEGRVHAIAVLRAFEALEDEANRGRAVPFIQTAFDLNENELMEQLSHRGPQVGTLSKLAVGYGPVYNMRLRAGMTQSEFAAATNLSLRTIGSCEKKGDYPQSRLARNAVLRFARKRGIEEVDVL